MGPGSVSRTWHAIRKIVHVLIIPLVLIGIGFLADRLTRYSWDQVVKYSSPYAAPLPYGPSGPALTERVVLVVVDGLRVDTSRTMATLNRLRTQGADLIATTGEPSLSLPGWTVIGSGAYQEVSAVTTNWYEGAVQVDSIFAQAKRKGLTTAMVGGPGWKQLFGQWLDFQEPIREPEAYGDLPGVQQTDERITARALALLQEKRPNLLLIHWHGPDYAGHSWGGASQQYQDDVQHIEGQLAQLVNALDLGTTTLMVTADHGQIDAGGHGGWEPVVKQVPLVLAGKGIKGGGAISPVGQADIAPTVAVLLGLAIPAHSQGRPLLEVLDASETVRGQIAMIAGQQLAGFYDFYAERAGSQAFARSKLAGFQPNLQTGDPRELARFYQELLQGAQAVRESRFTRERLFRLPITLILAVLPLVYVGLYPRKRELFSLPLVGMLAYFIVYNLLFFGIRRLQWSLSVFNTEEQLLPFFTGRAIDAIIALVIAVLVVAVLSRGRGWYAAALNLVHTSFWVSYALLVQILLFYWLFDVRFSWYIPDLALGFKYYLDLLQLASTTFQMRLPIALIALGLGLAVKGLADLATPIVRRVQDRLAVRAPFANP